MRTAGRFPTSAPGAALLAIPTSDPLLGTSGEARLPGTGDDLSAGDTLETTQASMIADGTVLCAIEMDPTTERLAELRVPLPASPTPAAQRKDGGWMDFGFRNQGQCVRYVETGKDSRADESV